MGTGLGQNTVAVAVCPQPQKIFYMYKKNSENCFYLFKNNFQFYWSYQYFCYLTSFIFFFKQAGVGEGGGGGGGRGGVR